MLLTASFGRIIPQRMLAAFPPHNRLNIHPSPLPAYRGAAPIQHMLMAGERETAVCVIEMLRKVDAGAVWGREELVSALCYYLGSRLTEITGNTSGCGFRDDARFARRRRGASSGASIAREDAGYGTSRFPVHLSTRLTDYRRHPLRKRRT